MGKMTGFRWGLGIAAAVVLLALPTMAGCNQQSTIAVDTVADSQDSASGLDASGREACAEFEAGWEEATDTPARLLLADSVERQVRRSDDPELTGSATAMGRSADEGDAAWRAAATDLLRTCGDTESATAPATDPTTAPTVLPVTG